MVRSFWFVKESVLSGDDALIEAINEHWTPVYRFVFCAVGDSHDAEDLTQETFLRAWNRRDSFLPGTSWRAWLLRIAANAVLDVQRRRRRVVFTSLGHEPTAQSPPPEHRLEVAEQGALLRAAMQELTELTRMVFHLRATEDLSFREIGELVGTTEQGARWHMHQARTRLLKQLAEKL
jgi:RNA polymerase sigma factor (sigma-70 family)